jgi:hypothetical protein
MNPKLNPEERELIRLVEYFRKRAQSLAAENKLPQDFLQMMETSDKLVEQMNIHAINREAIMSEREKLQNMIKDNAKCPKCTSSEMLKHIGFDVNSFGWKSNKYKCRRCNISFVWNAPNNPWDMVPYVEKFIKDTEEKIAQSPHESESQPALIALEQMKSHLAKLKPIVEASNIDLKELKVREADMEGMVRKVKKLLMIEKIKLED